jgi:hypothetical protein
MSDEQATMYAVTGLMWAGWFYMLYVYLKNKKK